MPQVTELDHHNEADMFIQRGVEGLINMSTLVVQ